MTVNVAAGRSVIDLGARTTVLEAMDRVRTSGNAEDIVLSVAAGAPVLRSPVFLEVLRRAAGSRRIALVTPDVRARSLAASVHVPAFASVAALERHEMDATEHLGPARRAAIVAAQPRTAPRSPVRLVAMLVAAILIATIATIVVAPTATVTVAPVSRALGPLEYDLRAGPNNADINATTLGPATITTKFTGTATGSRTEEAKAKGIERFTNQSTSDIKIPLGTVVRTADGVQFRTLRDETLPRSTIVIFPPSVNFGTVDIQIEAVDPGTKGNVDAKRINVSPNPGQYTVENPVATAGGETKKIPIVLLSDYDLAASRAETELRKEADKQLDTWKRQAKADQTVYGAVIAGISVSPAADVVGKELDPTKDGTFEISATGRATAYSVPSTEPRTTAVKRIATAADAGNEIDEDGAAVQIIGTSTVAADGVHWRVSVRASQFRQLDEAAIRSALIGRPFDDIERIVSEQGLRFVRLSTWPGWWPRMPILGARISIRSEAPANAGP
jgi:hypothetical protein